MKKTEIFDTSRLTLLPLSERKHDLQAACIGDVRPFAAYHPAFDEIAGRIIKAREQGASVILLMGGHVVRAGVQRYIIDLLETGRISCVAMNGSVMIHDFELALIGATTESVARYIQEGQFGLWAETGGINDIVGAAHRMGGTGMGEAVGRAIAEGEFPFKETSILAACWRLGIPATVHVGIGYDIIHEHPNFDGAAAGATSYLDFLRFAKSVEGLEHGVVMNYGSAVMAPEVYLKALAMARNVAKRENREIRHFTTVVCDLHELPEEFTKEPPKTSTGYYFRPWKTMLVRTVADGGESFYVRGRHEETIPALWTALQKRGGS